MPFEPLCFVHATDLLLDHPLREMGGVDDRYRRTLEDASLIAFDRLIDVTIQRKADFLLLAGGSFVADDRSLRAETALRRNLDRLGEHEIRVFVIPGRSDPAAAWRRLPNLPDNVTPLLDEQCEPVAVIRDGNVIASISVESATKLIEWSETPIDLTRPASAYRGPFTVGSLMVDDNMLCPGDRDNKYTKQKTTPDGDSTVGLLTETPFAQHLADCPLDYLALGGPGRRCSLSMRTGIAHHPGSIQAHGPHDSGPHGFTFINVDSDGMVHSNFIPAAPVRYETASIRIHEETHRNDLAQQLRDRFSQFHSEAGEELWFLEWAVEGDGPLVEMFQSAVERAPLLEAAELSTSLAKQVQLSHSYRLLWQDPGNTHVHRHEPLAAEYFTTLADLQPDSKDALLRAAASALPEDDPHRERLVMLVDEVDRATVAARARRLGMVQFNTLPEEGSLT